MHLIHRAMPLKKAWGLLKKYPHHIVAIVLVSLWCAPYITTGNRVEWGDFGIFTQGYQAIRISILQYHQFPWWNAWMAGGTPLYANPQLGVFSLQTLLVLVFGAPMGLKLSLIIMTFLGYVSMYWLLSKYFKTEARVATALSLGWIFCSFFVAHLPSHYTFAWFLLAPAFVYMALTISSLKQGIILGLALGLCALSSLHYSFFQIATIVALLVAVRMIRERGNVLPLLKYCGAAVLVFLLLAGHRLLFTAQNVHDFSRDLVDPPTTFANSILSIILPYSVRHLHFISYPSTFYNWAEQTATLGIVLNLLVLLCVTYFVYTIRKNGFRNHYALRMLILLSLGLAIFAIGLGNFSPISPWGILRHIPPFSFTRVASRWFIWLILVFLLIIAVTFNKVPLRSAYRFSMTSLLYLGVLELFFLNIGYQSKILSRPVTLPDRPTSNYTFEQTGGFGEVHNLPDGKGQIPNDGTTQRFYREFENTSYNLGTLQANDALVDLNTKPTPRCSWAIGCGYVLSKNAKVVYWSPNKVVLQRTAPGKIIINANNSNYFLINGSRPAIRVAEPYKDFVIATPPNEHTITIQVSPSLSVAL